MGAVTCDPERPVAHGLVTVPLGVRFCTVQDVALVEPQETVNGSPTPVIAADWERVAVGGGVGGRAQENESCWDAGETLPAVSTDLTTTACEPEVAYRWFAATSCPDGTVPLAGILSYAALSVSHSQYT